MVINAYMILHYGHEWLPWAIRSVRHYVDEIHITYTDSPSHGNIGNVAKPSRESRDSLVAEVTNEINSDVGAKIFWHDAGRFAHEGLHREYAYNFAKNADAVIVLDADEIWPRDQIIGLRKFVESDVPKKHSYRIHMRHFWRSLKWICDDPSMPTRLIIPSVADNSEEYLPTSIFHMGYAQTPELIRYKESIHGHKAEWREGWFTNKFMNWKPGDTDVHPTCVNFWNPVPYNDDGTLQALLNDHPYFYMDMIL